MDDVLLIDLAAEHQVLDDLVAPLPPEVWAKPSPSPGWTLAHQIHHLDVSEHAALLSLTGRSDQIFSTPRAWPGPPLPDDPAEVLDNWRESRAASLEAMYALDSKDPVIWGDGPMSCRSFATARLMETWAHGLDCFTTAGVEPTDTDRLRHVAHIGYRALPYAFRSQDVTPPAPLSELRLELTSPSGERWTYGEPHVPQSITGPASHWCRVATRRMNAADSGLVADGPLAQSVLTIARAYLSDGVAS
ncbi:MAG: maleylpyruvate isomerase family mycothiol-dependent enzyme [Acidimicrobiia bacterium]|nr:maleylpyruvate isomerase family mycothiol-dependent enzyme [Acidimicrobiia bacterium]MCY4434947.1 maleylpyruvate isomerase family mycothiol-dependent enzyme [bacterium]